MLPMVRISLVAGFFLIINSGAISQTSESIRSDRPGQAFSPFTVGRGIFQLQSGLIYQRQASTITSKFLTFENFFRYGLTERWEVSATVNYSNRWIVSDTTEETSNGISNWGFTSRINLVNLNGGATGFGILGGVNFTNRVSERFETEKVIPILAFLFSHSFSFMGISANAGPIWDGSSSDPASGLYALNLSFSLPANLGLFIENFGLFRRNEFDTFFDGGISFLPRKNLQIDVFAGFGENENISDVFVATGVSWRIE